jgi:hypothetical protein
MTRFFADNRLWRALTLLARLDMAAGVLMAAALLTWLTWLGAR